MSRTRNSILDLPCEWQRWNTSNCFPGCSSIWRLKLSSPPCNAGAPRGDLAVVSNACPYRNLLEIETPAEPFHLHGPYPLSHHQMQAQKGFLMFISIYHKGQNMYVRTLQKLHGRCTHQEGLCRDFNIFSYQSKFRFNSIFQSTFWFPWFWYLWLCWNYDCPSCQVTSNLELHLLGGFQTVQPAGTVLTIICCHHAI